MKSLCTLLVVNAFALLCVATARPNYGVRYEQRFNGDDFCLGQQKGNDRLLYQTHVIHRGGNIRWNTLGGYSTPHVRFGFIGKVTVDIDLPMTSRSIGGTISYIEGLNQGRCVGSVRVTRGGVGYDYVTLHFEADYWMNIDFVIKVYGCYRGYC